MIEDYKNPNKDLFSGKFEFIPKDTHWCDWGYCFICLDGGYMAFEKDEDANIYLDTYIRNVA